MEKVVESTLFYKKIISTISYHTLVYAKRINEDEANFHATPNSHITVHHRGLRAERSEQV